MLCQDCGRNEAEETVLDAEGNEVLVCNECAEDYTDYDEGEESENEDESTTEE